MRIWYNHCYVIGKIFDENLSDVKLIQYSDKGIRKIWALLFFVYCVIKISGLGKMLHSMRNFREFYNKINRDRVKF